MSFLRPEAQATLLRYREALIGVAVLALGLWWAWGGIGLLQWLGVLVALAGGLLFWSGLRHARILVVKGGVGVVQIDERQITYLAPVGGGFSSLDDVQIIEIARDRAGLAVWRFCTGSDVLAIPSRAEGAEAIFDALTTLTGADIDAAIRATRQPPEKSLLVWRRPLRKLH